jgi:hypothetical protein
MSRRPNDWELSQLVGLLVEIQTLQRRIEDFASLRGQVSPDGDLHRPDLDRPGRTLLPSLLSEDEQGRLLMMKM